MNLKDLNRWLTPLTNVAVLIGLILIVIELRQNQESMELDRKIALVDSMHSDFSNISNSRSRLINNPEVAELYIKGAQGDELSETDELRFMYLCIDMFWSAVMMYDRAMMMERDEYADATVAWIQGAVKRQGLAACWNDVKHVYVNYGFGDFVEAVDSPASNAPPDAQ